MTTCHQLGATRLFRLTRQSRAGRSLRLCGLQDGRSQWFSSLGHSRRSIKESGALSRSRDGTGNTTGKTLPDPSGGGCLPECREGTGPCVEQFERDARRLGELRLENAALREENERLRRRTVDKSSVRSAISCIAFDNVDRGAAGVLTGADAARGDAEESCGPTGASSCHSSSEEKSKKEIFDYLSEASKTRRAGRGRGGCNSRTSEDSCRRCDGSGTGAGAGVGTEGEQSQKEDVSVCACPQLCLVLCGGLALLGVSLGASRLTRKRQDGQDGAAASCSSVCSSPHPVSRFSSSSNSVQTEEGEIDGDSANGDAGKGKTPMASGEPYMNPLHEAAVRGRVDVLKRLVKEEGVDVNAKDKDGDTALHRASLSGQKGAVVSLLELGADVEAASDRHGRTAVHAAAERGHVDVLRVLLNAGAEAMRGDRKKGTTALHVACRGGHRDVVLVLLWRGASEAVNIRDAAGDTALHEAARSGDRLLVRTLLAFRADPNPVNRDGRTPLHLACRRGNAEAAAELVGAWADRHCPDKEGLTPMQTALHHCHPKTLQALRIPGPRLQGL
uniref:Uncharacterized protein n=1 Tax=Chromera velia CCMP2878 TaxID=1169474 RepID=A0A0G4GD46_9ALVE|eukprot:Cvel_21368.t1-p1 / transcript=Cvel_21368.t1 / gene=Cvel_21368 / organism=Chromera_velia_CCMP2878 / gene_product=Ankyrin repeat domain-containing protein 6, putative / transcript_product=Ankyrin repeat domain-containing protein 6, putative / location=Cvel_scaffold1998:12233-16597(-) / protein_length=559 / sequence_SO=supercontig / SO=protein_coding / is_pseudo=false